MNKKLNILMITLFISAGTLVAQENEIAMKTSEKDFIERHPAIENAEWHTNKNGFHVNYRHNNYNHITNYDKNGNFIDTRRIIEWEHTPENIQEAHMNSHFSDWQVAEVYLVQNADGDTFYALKLNDPDGIKFAFYSDTGKALSKQDKFEFIEETK